MPKSLSEWVKRVQVDTGVRGGVTTADAQRVKELERENEKSRRAFEILVLASAFFFIGGTGPLMQVMKQFIEQHRHTHGV